MEQKGDDAARALQNHYATQKLRKELDDLVLYLLDWIPDVHYSYVLVICLKYM